MERRVPIGRHWHFLNGSSENVRVIPPLQKIIDRYFHCSPWVFPIMKNRVLCKQYPVLDRYTPSAELYNRYKQALSDYWYHLGVISRELNIEKRLTFNMNRHSWASLARTHGIAMAVISEALGHNFQGNNAYLSRRA